MNPPATELRSTSPDGRYEIRIAPWEARMSLWVETPFILARGAPQPLLRFRDSRWSLDRAEWLSKSLVRLQLRKYPGSHEPASIELDIDCGNETACLPDGSSVALAQLEDALEGCLKWRPAAAAQEVGARRGGAALADKGSGARVSITWAHFAAWLLMLFVAILNGAARDVLYAPYMSELAAHQVSSLTGIVLLGIVIAIFVRRRPPASGRQAAAVGLLWLLLTIAFEFAFFHFVGGHSWNELVANYDLRAGRIWVLVLLWIAAAPYLMFRLRTRR